MQCRSEPVDHTRRMENTVKPGQPGRKPEEAFSAAVAKAMLVHVRLLISVDMGSLFAQSRPLTCRTDSPGMESQVPFPQI